MEQVEKESRDVRVNVEINQVEEKEEQEKSRYRLNKMD